MKASLIPTMVLLAFAALADAQSNLTNDVPITEGGMRLIISGGDLPWIDPTAAPKELKVEAPMSWILHSASSNAYALLWLRGSNSFVVNLTTTNGIAVPKTARGRNMGRGPKSLTNRYDRGAIPISVWHGRVEVSDFPPLTNLFVFPSNGVYVLQVQCWAWSQSKKQFVLSSPLRVGVIKDAVSNPPAPSR